VISPEEGSFLAELTLEERADLERRGRRRRWDTAATLFSEGDLSTWVFVLLDGRVKASSHGENGTEMLLAVRGMGALLGEVSAIDGLPRSASVVALEPLEALVLSAEEFLSFLQANWRVSRVLMRMLCERMRDADRKRTEFGIFDATSRVAQRLVELADRFGEPYQGSVMITLHLTQEELAGWVGASREAVSKALRSLRSRGWIETGRRTVIVHNLEALRKRAR
jgi:CRP/FNR family transcriptional regulator, cyclic AMP receptor protein